MPAPAAVTDTAQEILDAAERLVQTHGFNAFSYADIATKVGITKASLHYHFATKAELGRSLITRYHERFFAALTEIDVISDDAREKLNRYVELYTAVLEDNRMCLCGMLASDFSTLPKAMKDGVKRFFDANESWLATTLEQGRKARQLRFEAPGTEVARTFVSTLEGAMLVARSYADVARFSTVANWLLRELAVNRA